VQVVLFPPGALYTSFTFLLVLLGKFVGLCLDLDSISKVTKTRMANDTEENVRLTVIEVPANPGSCHHSDYGHSVLLSAYSKISTSLSNQLISAIDAAKRE
jgi:hypothetical protein